MSSATRCRSCSTPSLNTIHQWEPPAASAPAALATAELGTQELAFCPKCMLVQRVFEEHTPKPNNTDYVPPQQLASWPARQLTSQIIATQKLRPTNLVLQIGSREGRLLNEYQAAGVPVLGIEPAVRLAELARLEHGVPTLCRYFDRTLALHLLNCGQPADVVHLSYLLPLVDDLDAVVSGLPIVLKDSGIAVVEVPYVRRYLDCGNLWAPQQKQLSYFSLTSLHNLLSRHKLVIHDVERSADGGTSLRLFVGKQGETSSRVATLLTDENSWGVDRLGTYLPQRHAKVA